MRLISFWHRLVLRRNHTHTKCENHLPWAKKIKWSSSMKKKVYVDLFFFSSFSLCTHWQLLTAKQTTGSMMEWFILKHKLILYQKNHRIKYLKKKNSIQNTYIDYSRLIQKRRVLRECEAKLWWLWWSQSSKEKVIYALLSYDSSHKLFQAN